MNTCWCTGRRAEEKGCSFGVDPLLMAQHSPAASCQMSVQWSLKSGTFSQESLFCRGGEMMVFKAELKLTEIKCPKLQCNYNRQQRIEPTTALPHNHIYEVYNAQALQIFSPGYVDFREQIISTFETINGEFQCSVSQRKVIHISKWQWLLELGLQRSQNLAHQKSCNKAKCFVIDKRQAARQLVITAGVCGV